MLRHGKLAVAVALTAAILRSHASRSTDEEVPGSSLLMLHGRVSSLTVNLSENETHPHHLFEGNLTDLPDLADKEAHDEGWEEEDKDGEEFDDSALEEEEGHGDEGEEGEDDVEEKADMNLLGHPKPERALLSTRGRSGRGGCSYCYCLLESAVHCGTSVVQDASACGVSYVQDAASCGSSTVTNAATCGVDISKSCKWSRRRRLGKLNCDFKETAKSCTVANKCNVANKCPIANECDVASTFSSCLGEVLGSVSGTCKEFLDIVTDTGCASATGCRDTINGGPDAVWNLLLDEVQAAVEPQIDRIAEKLPFGLDEVKSYVKAAKSGGGPAVSQAASVAGEVGAWFGGTFGSFSKYDIGSLCTVEGSGFWYMQPTDCGAFDEMSSIFASVSGAASGFNSAVSKLGQCVRMTGMFDVPTPFLEMKVERFCLPAPMLTPIEYFMGAVIYAADVAKSLAADIKAVITKIQGIADSIGLLELGRTVHNGRSTGNASRETGSECGSQANWGVEIFAGVAVSATGATGNTVAVSFDFGLLMGCLDDKLVDTNWMLNLGLARGISSNNQASDTYPSFSNRAAFGAGFDITLQAEVAEVAAANVPVNFGVLPSSLPSSFTIAANPSGEAGELLQARRDIEAAATAAGRRAAPGHGLAAALAEATRQLGNSEALDLAKKAVPSHHELAKTAMAMQSEGHALAAKHLTRHAERMRPAHATGGPKDLATAAALEQVRGETRSADSLPPVKVDAELAATVCATFCITPLSCNGQ